MFPLLVGLQLFVYKALLLTNISLPGSGRFLIWLAKNSVEPRNYLGLEIRQKVLDIIMKQYAAYMRMLALYAYHFLFANDNLCIFHFNQLFPPSPQSCSVAAVSSAFTVLG